jgi:hypothetical protein
VLPLAIGAGSRAEEDEWGRESRVGLVEESMVTNSEQVYDGRRDKWVDS